MKVDKYCESCGSLNSVMGFNRNKLGGTVWTSCIGCGKQHMEFTSDSRDIVNLIVETEKILGVIE